MTHSPQWEIARAARAASRDNATDRVAAALTLFGLDGQASRYVADAAASAVAGWLQEHGQADAAALVLESHPVSAEVGAAERALDRVRTEVRNWPAADFWHRDAIMRAIHDGCTCGEAWSGHPNPHALTCPASSEGA